METYDVCTVVDAARQKDVSSLFLRAQSSARAKSYTFFNGSETFTLGARINSGASGTVYAGTFGQRAIAIKVNNPRRVSATEDFHEVALQTRLFCHLRDRAQPIPADAAKIPEVFFAVTIPRMGRALGMAQMEVSLLARLTALTTPAKQVALLHTALRRVAQLLLVLQTDLQFMHGDLHGENVMLRVTPKLDVYVIDLGMGSARLPGKAARTVTDLRYRRLAFNPHLDLLTLLTALREDLALESHSRAAAWCDAFVKPFWDTVRGGLFSGKVRPKLRYSAHRTVRAAREEISDSGEVYYAHHLLYENVHDVAFPPCHPGNFLRVTDGRVPKQDVDRVRIFEDA